MGGSRRTRPLRSSASAFVNIQWFQTADHDAEAEIMALPLRPRDKALAQLARLSSLSKAQFRIKPTYVDDVFEAKLDTPEGGLRLIFTYGRNSVVWCLGGFVKRNDAQGNRLLRSYAKWAKAAKQL
jgi:hypothetical protein